MHSLVLGVHSLVLNIDLGEECRSGQGEPAWRSQMLSNVFYLINCYQAWRGVGVVHLALSKAIGLTILN